MCLDDLNPRWPPNICKIRYNFTGFLYETYISCSNPFNTKDNTPDDNDDPDDPGVDSDDDGEGCD